MRPNPVKFSKSEPASNSDDGAPVTVGPPTLHHLYLPKDVSSVGWGGGATEPFARLADNALGLVFPPFRMHAEEVSAAPTSTPQTGSLRAPSNHQDIRSRERLDQKCHAPQGHATLHSHVTANEVLVAGCPQDTCPRGAVSNASGSEKSRKIFTSRQKARPHGRRSKPQKNYEPSDWLGSGEARERAGRDNAPSPCAVYAEEYDKLLRAPLMRPIPLPDHEVRAIKPERTE
ncbi:hypothetical protein EI94DRAFT_1797456 [Lactarius quietus]|nr:hypothetical protein EI94DRAFT_1797456 [Lactarius quietus]